MFLTLNFIFPTVRKLLTSQGRNSLSHVSRKQAGVDCRQRCAFHHHQHESGHFASSFVCSQTTTATITTTAEHHDQSPTMAHADIHTDNIRIRTILQITAFDLATLEYNLMRYAYVPDSLDEQKIRDATYRFYKASISHTSHSYVSRRCFNIFDPYPYGEKPKHDTNILLSAQLAAAVADRNERVSIKYDAVMDLIRMLAARKFRQGKAADAGAKVEQDTVTVTKEQLEEGKSKIKAMKEELERLRSQHATVKPSADGAASTGTRKVNNRGRRRVRGRQTAETRARRRARQKAAAAAASEMVKAEAECSNVIAGAPTDVDVKQEEQD
jgi:hypothetical protein